MASNEQNPHNPANAADDLHQELLADTTTNNIDPNDNLKVSNADEPNAAGLEVLWNAATTNIDRNDNLKVSNADEPNADPNPLRLAANSRDLSVREEFENGVELFTRILTHRDLCMGRGKIPFGANVVSKQLMPELSALKNSEEPAIDVKVTDSRGVELTLKLTQTRDGKNYSLFAEKWLREMSIKAEDVITFYRSGLTPDLYLIEAITAADAKRGLEILADAALVTNNMDRNDNREDPPNPLPLAANSSRDQSVRHEFENGVELYTRKVTRGDLSKGRGKIPFSADFVSKQQMPELIALMNSGETAIDVKVKDSRGVAFTLVLTKTKDGNNFRYAFSRQAADKWLRDMSIKAGDVITFYRSGLTPELYLIEVSSTDEANAA